MRREYLEIGLVITWKQLSIFLKKKMLEDKFAFEKHFVAGEIVCGSLY